jgi:ATP-dependent DNA helicase PIF1
MNLFAKQGEKVPGTVHLCATNRGATEINEKELEKLNGEIHTYNGLISGKLIPENDLPSPFCLRLKKGAQVIFTKNGIGYVNGTVGVVESLEADLIHVRILSGSTHSILSVARTFWETFNFKLDPGSKQLVRHIVSVYFQFPLRMAWAITIHKAQGKTLDHAIIDLEQRAFSHGQTYVGLSRCRTMAGTRLARPLRLQDIIVDPKVRKFMGQTFSQIDA